MVLPKSVIPTSPDSKQNGTHSKLGGHTNENENSKNGTHGPVIPYEEENFGAIYTKKRRVYTSEEIVKRRANVIGGGTQIHYPECPLKIVKGRGQYLYEEDGTRYLDLMNNVAHVGHCHPHVTKAGQDQMAELYTNSRFLHDEIVNYTQRLTATLPSKLTHVYLTCTGTESNDLAFRLARCYTKKQDAMILDRAYHGHSVAVIDLSPYKFNHEGGDGQKDYIHMAPCPDTFRGMYTGDNNDPSLGTKYADEVKKIIDQAYANGREIGMFMAESLQSCGGQVIYPEGYLKQVYQHIRAAGGVCVADEVQVGFGRVGKKFWAFELHDVEPDMITIGKPMGNGHPVSAVVCTKEISDAFAATTVPYFNTFGGNPVSCAVANSVMDVIEEENLQSQADELGTYWVGELEKMKERHRLIGDVRGCGFFIGIEISQDSHTKTPATIEAKAVAFRLRQQRILISRDGPDNNVLKIKPPMCLKRSDIDYFNEQLDKVLLDLERDINNGEDWTAEASVRNGQNGHE